MEDGRVRGVPFLAPLLGGTIVALFVDIINLSALYIYHRIVMDTCTKFRIY
jgi:hypothetical protein